MNRLSIVLILFMAVLTSCHKKPISQTHPLPSSPPTALNDIASFSSAINSLTPQYQWLRIKSSVHFENPQNSYNAVALIKLRNDSLIWTSANVMIEVARAIVTKDTVAFINRANKTYSKTPVSDLKSLFAIEGIDLKSLQYLLLAYPPFGIKSNATMVAENNVYKVKTQGYSYSEEFEVDKSTMRMTRYYYEKNTNQKLTVNYSEFKNINGNALPQKIEFIVQTPDKIVLTLNQSDYSFLPVDEAPFNIPASYQPVK